MSSERAAFDAWADDYEAQLDRGIGLSGEGKEYFARGRLDFCAAWWAGHRDGPPRRIVDYGCGVGDVTALLGQRWPEAEVLGVDPSRRAIELARETFARPGLRFEVLGPERLEREPGAGKPAQGGADLVHLNGVVHHVPVAERPGLFRALADLLGPRGVVALFENNPLNPATHLVMARIPFDRDAVKVPHWEARRRLTEAGLRARATGFLFYFPRALGVLRPLERLLLRLPLGAQYGVMASAREKRP